jgi:hypothetical protein
MADREDDGKGNVIPLKSYVVGDVESAHALMACVFEHYRKHHEVVLRKLEHAQSATAQSLKEIEDFRRGNRERGSQPEKTEDIRKYEAMWEQIIEVFNACGISEDELEKVENILLRIPRLIRNYYEARVRQDKILQAAIKDLASEKYKRAFGIVEKIQSQPDRLSGLEASAFESGYGVEAHIFKNLPRKKKPKGKNR